MVDDIRLNRTVLRGILELDGYELIEATNGLEALEVIRTRPIDLVVLDVMLPGIDGIEVCRRIRSQHEGWKLPVIAVTAYDDAAQCARMRQVGADDVLGKPLNPDELLARVRNLLLVRASHELSEQLRIQAEREAARWKLISAVAVAVVDCLDFASLVSVIAQELQQALDVEAVAFFALHDGRLELVAASPAWSRYTDLVDETLQGVTNPTATLELALRLALAMPGVSALPIVAGGAVQGCFCIARDRPYEPEVRSLLADIAAHLANAVTSVRSHMKSTQLAEAHRQLSELLVHDFKNPLQVLRFNFDVLADESSTAADRSAALSESETAANNLLRLVQDLLETSRAESIQLPFNPATVSLEAVARDALRDFARDAARRHVTLTCDIEAHLVVHADPRLLRRMLENILANGLRHVCNGGGIELSAYLDDDSVIVEIINDGPPIPVAARAKIFERYGTHGSVRNNHQGLGLYFCRLVAERHRGTIEVADRDSGGVCFKIRLPATAATAHVLTSV